MTYYINGSVSLAVPITIDGVAITTAYSSGDIMNNPAATYGIVRFTAYDSTGAVAKSNNVAVQDIYCYCDSTHSNIGDAAIAYGFQAAGTYVIVPVFGIKDGSGNLSWRELEKKQITVFAMTSSGIAVSPNVTI